MSQILPATIPPDVFEACADSIVETARRLDTCGWTPATSSNFSMRVDDSHAAITVSGRHKGRLGRDDIMLIDLYGKPVGTDARPSAETALHTQIYRRWPDMQAVLHTHSRTQSVASRLFADDGIVRLAGWELQKAITGHATHESVLEIPIFPNTQHMPDLVAQVDAWLDSGKPLHAYLINGHGIYTWGRSMAETERHLDALEFLLDCELELKKLRAS